MADIIESDVLAIAPELSILTAQAWVDILAFVNEVDLTEVGDSAAMTRIARLYLAAHFGLNSSRGGTAAAGPVTAETAGAVRRSYGLMAQAAGTNSLASTLYGQQYIAILQMSSAHGPMLV